MREHTTNYQATQLMFFNISRLLLPTFFCLISSGCSTHTAGITDTVNAFLYSPQDVSALKTLNPSVRYLRVVAPGGVSLLALGYVDKHPFGPIEVWYSSVGDVLRIQNGHIVGLTGGSVQWRHVSFSNMPKWLEDQTSKTTYERTRDVMPGYLFGVRDYLELAKTSAPSPSNFVALAGAQSVRVQWYEANEKFRRLPTARFAVQSIGGVQTVVYGEQCLSLSFCLTWQLWPTADSPK